LEKFVDEEELKTYEKVVFPYIVGNALFLPNLLRAEQEIDLDSIIENKNTSAELEEKLNKIGTEDVEVSKKKKKKISILTRKVETKKKKKEN